MYGLDPDTDLSFIVGRELIQVAVGQYQVILRFTSEVSITIESDIQMDGGEAIADSRTAGAALLELIGAEVEGAAGVADGTLTITWRNARRLTIFDSWSEYESYTVSAPGVTIVV